jgi:hypothetical protein
MARTMHVRQRAHRTDQHRKREGNRSCALPLLSSQASSPEARAAWNVSIPRIRRVGLLAQTLFDAHCYAERYRVGRRLAEQLHSVPKRRRTVAMSQSQAIPHRSYRWLVCWEYQMAHDRQASTTCKRTDAYAWHENSFAQSMGQGGRHVSTDTVGSPEEGFAVECRTC